MITIDEFFSELLDWEDKSVLLAKALVSIWKAKLKKDFPEANFEVQYQYEEEAGDYGLTFYQLTKEGSSKTNPNATEILHPNVKENKLEESSKGPRPGIPKIRKPRTDEIP